MKRLSVCAAGRTQAQLCSQGTLLVVVQALITGPEDTPYDCGAFVFDICIPEGYPASPPYVLLRFVYLADSARVINVVVPHQHRVARRTTGGGSVRFNPNLYNCGKVCLSLLGTWSGSHPCEQWSSSSTLLQVRIH